MLLHVNARDFFKALSSAFDSKSSNKKLTEITNQLINLVIDRKVPATFGEGHSPDWPFDVVQQGYLFLFIARYVSLGMVRIDDYIRVQLIIMSTCHVHVDCEVERLS